MSQIDSGLADLWLAAWVTLSKGPSLGPPGLLIHWETTSACCFGPPRSWYLVTQHDNLMQRHTRTRDHSQTDV